MSGYSRTARTLCMTLTLVAAFCAQRTSDIRHWAKFKHENFIMSYYYIYFLYFERFQNQKYLFENVCEIQYAKCISNKFNLKYRPSLVISLSIPRKHVAERIHISFITGVEELSTTVDLLRDQLNVCCESLVKVLKRRDTLIARRDAKCNMITALLHAYSMKRSELNWHNNFRHSLYSYNNRKKKTAGVYPATI